MKRQSSINKSMVKLSKKLSFQILNLARILNDTESIVKIDSMEQMYDDKYITNEEIFKNLQNHFSLVKPLEEVEEEFQ